MSQPQQSTTSEICADDVLSRWRIAFAYFAHAYLVTSLYFLYGSVMTQDFHALSPLDPLYFS
jgi:hypothetical protein